MHRKDDDDGNVYTMKLDGNNPLKIVFLCAYIRLCVLCVNSPLARERETDGKCKHKILRL